MYTAVITINSGIQLNLYQCFVMDVLEATQVACCLSLMATCSVKSVC